MISHQPEVFQIKTLLSLISMAEPRRPTLRKLALLRDAFSLLLLATSSNHEAHMEARNFILKTLTKFLSAPETLNLLPKSARGLSNADIPLIELLHLYLALPGAKEDHIIANIFQLASYDLSALTMAVGLCIRRIQVSLSNSDFKDTASAIAVAEANLRSSSAVCSHQARCLIIETAPSEMSFSEVSPMLNANPADWHDAAISFSLRFCTSGAFNPTPIEYADTISTFSGPLVEDLSFLKQL